jgi:hypothetical protein
MDPKAVWLTGASQPIPVYGPPLGGSHLHSTWCTHISPYFKLSILSVTWSILKLQKLHTPFKNP